VRTACPLPEPTGAGSLPPRRCAGQWSARPMARRSSWCCEPGEGRCRCSLRPRRTPRPDIGISFARRSSRFSRPITDTGGLTRGHAGIEPCRRPPLDPLRSDSASTPRVLATGEISPASFPVSAARWPTRRTACAFSPAVSLRRCRSATTDPSRPSPVPFSRMGRHGSSFHPRRGPPGEPGGVNLTVPNAWPTA